MEVNYTESKKVLEEKEQKKINDEEDKAYETEKIVDYSKNFISEKKLSSARKSDNDYEIVTDQLEDEDEKQNDERKVVVAQKSEPTKLAAAEVPKSLNNSKRASLKVGAQAAG